MDKGGNGMNKAALFAELKMLGKRCICLDIAAWCISNFFLGLNLRFALGLLLGTAVLFVNLLILHRSIALMAYDAKRTGSASSKRHFAYYLLRLGVLGAAFSLAMCFPAAIAPLGVAVPPLYPRLIYTLQAVFRKQSCSERGENRNK